MTDAQKPLRPRLISLPEAAFFILKKPALVGWSGLLILLTALLTWVGFQLTTGLMDDVTGTFFQSRAQPDSIWGWVKYSGWIVSKWLFLIVSRLVAFYLAFLLAYTCTTPFYGFLSTSTEKLYLGQKFTDDPFTVLGILRDLWEGLKIGLFGLIVTLCALVIGFVPLFGQLAVILMYIFYSTLMFIDYPASRRRWSLGEKLQWLKKNRSHSIRIGVLPAFVGMIPLLNLVLMAVIFPVCTVHATLNFVILEMRDQAPPPASPR